MGISYSRLINGLTKKKIILNRKMLSDIAVNDEAAFEKIAKTVLD